MAKTMSWKYTVCDVQQLHSFKTKQDMGGEKKSTFVLKRVFFLSPGWCDQSKFTSKIHPGNQIKYYEGEQVNSKRQIRIK